MAGSIALPYPGAGNNPNDDDGDSLKVGKRFFQDIFGKMSKDQRKQMAEDFKAFANEERQMVGQDVRAKNQYGRSTGLEGATEVLVAESPAAAYQMAVAQDQEVQLLGAAQMVNELMLESKAAKSDERMM